MRTGTLVGALVVLGGYTLALWGWAQLQGPGIGFGDLILPSRLCGFAAKVDAARAATGGTSGVAAGSTVNPNGTVSPPPAPSNLGINPNTGQIGATTPAAGQGSAGGVGAVINPLLGNG